MRRLGLLSPGVTEMSKKTPLPDDFKVSDRIVVLAKENGWPSPASEIEAFKDYHLAHGSTMVDWDAAFRTWLRNCVKWAKTAPAHVSPPPIKLEPVTERRYDPRVAELLSDLVQQFDKRSI